MMVRTAGSVTKDQDAKSALRFLAKAGKILASSLSYETTLKSVARLSVPYMADLCIVDILETDGAFKRLAIAANDPAKEKLTKPLLGLYTKPPEGRRGTPKTLRTGKADVISYIRHIGTAATSRSQEYLAIIGQLGIVSEMSLPLRARGRLLGAITFDTAESNRHYTSDHVRVAEELARLAAQAIDNARLYRSAEQALQARDEFLSIASHELKTPITSIKVFTEILGRKLQGKVDEDTLRYLSRMDTQVTRLVKLIGDLLDVSRIQAGKLALSEELFDINELIKEVCDTIQPLSKHHTIIIRGRIDQKIYADRDRIGQVLTNLVNNAVAYSPKADKVVITLRSGTRTLKVSVKDFGIGISEADQKRIFERFYRGSSSDGQAVSGQGLGLFIAYEVITRHKGKITVKSQPGKGSTFSFTLPIRR